MEEIVRYLSCDARSLARERVRAKLSYERLLEGLRIETVGSLKSRGDGSTSGTGFIE